MSNADIFKNCFVKKSDLLLILKSIHNKTKFKFNAHFGLNLIKINIYIELIKLDYI